MIRAPQRLPDPTMAWVKPDGRPTDAFYQYMRERDDAMRLLIEQANANAITLAEYELRLVALETP